MKLARQFFSGLLIIVGLMALIKMPFENRGNEVNAAGVDFMPVLKFVNLDPVMFKWGIFAVCVFFVVLIVTKIGGIISN